ncbi:MAG: alpha/beta fold hydrolase [Sulfitobacter sp.]
MLRILLRTLLFILLIVVFALFALRFAAFMRESQGAVDIAPDTGAFIETASGSIFIQNDGPSDGSAVLLAHGTAAWSGFWRSEIDMLEREGLRVTAFDMPPFGFSGRAADGDYSRGRQATRILDLVAATGQRPILIAHSFGAAAATEAVLREPTAFLGLIIINGAIGLADTPTPTTLPIVLRPRFLREAAVSATATNPLLTKTLLRGLLYNKDAATDAQVDVLQLPQIRRGTTAAYADWVPSLLAPDPTALSRSPANYTNIPIPVRIIWGDKDTVTPPAQAEMLARAIGQGPVTYLKDVGHIPHIEAPEAFATALKAAIQGILDD